MRKQITFYILSNTGSIVKQASISRNVLYLASILIAAGGLCFCYLIYGYQGLKKIDRHNQVLENKMLAQKDEIITQRKQIQSFANEINDLKSEILDLNRFEKKIRVIANLEKTSKQNDEENIFGVGGSAPEDIDSSLPVTSRHNSLIREIHQHIGQLNLASAKQKNEFKTILKGLEEKRNLLASTPSIRPVKGGWISSRFGHRVSPFTGRREFHKGLDIANHKKTPVIATADGTVIYSKKKGLLGNLTVINHGHGMVTRYAHLHKLLKKRGEKVKRGDIIGLLGNTGRSTGPHLHYEIKLNGIQVNPEKYIFN